MEYFLVVKNSMIILTTTNLGFAKKYALEHKAILYRATIINY